MMKQDILFTVLFFYLVQILAGQNIYADDRHNTSYNTGWMSCYESTNPNAERGTTHWIMYDFRREYSLFQVHLWNYNAPESLGNGIQEFIIDVSMDGVNWTESERMTLTQADGSSFYTGQNGPNLEGVQARYLLITAVSNYGGDCFGLSEVKVQLEQTVLPVTFLDQYIDCKEGKSTALISWQVENEFNNDRYEVETSIDQQLWTTHAEKPSLNHTEKSTYSVEVPVRGITYLRIKQIDFDGSASYFPVLKADCELKDSYFTTYPNPATNESLVTYHPISSAPVQLILTDVNGKQVKKAQWSGHQKIIQYNLDLSDLLPGTYVLSMREENRISTETILKMRNE